MQADTRAFIRLVKHPFKFSFYLLANIPSAFFSGVHIREISEEACTVTIPFTWFSQNPFRSTYFACLAMAAELSTGALLMEHTYKSRPSVSILVTRMEASFYKKATGTTRFVCADGMQIREAIADAVKSRQAGTITALSTGRNKTGETVAEFRVTWSFKARN